VGREAATAYSRNLCPQLASAIAYRVPFSLFPLGIFLVSIFSLMIQNAEPRHQIVTWLVDDLLLSPEGSVRLNEAVNDGLAIPLRPSGSSRSQASSGLHPERMDSVVRDGRAARARVAQAARLSARD
jgi:hypothetical protein